MVTIKILSLTLLLFYSFGLSACTVSQFRRSCTRYACVLTEGLAFWKLQTAIYAGKWQDVELDGVPTALGNSVNPDQIKALTEGKPAKEIYVATHVPKQAQNKIAEHLSDPRFKDIGRLVLSNESYAIASRKFADAATLIQFSQDGEFLAHINADIVHLVGGNCTVCLLTTMDFIVDYSLNKTTRESQTIVLHGDHIYGKPEVKTGEKPSDYAKRVVTSLFAVYRMSLNSVVRTFEMEPDQPTVNADGKFEFVFSRTSDGKALKIVYE